MRKENNYGCNVNVWIGIAYWNRRCYIFQLHREGEEVKQERLAIIASHFYYDFIHVHLCQIVSNGPCLWFLSHQLQKATCIQKITKPISKLTLYPQ